MEAVQGETPMPPNTPNKAPTNTPTKAPAPPPMAEVDVRPVDARVSDTFVRDHAERLFAGVVEFRYGDLLDAGRVRRLKELESAVGRVPRYCFGAFAQGALVGVSETRQVERGTLLMNLSAVLPEERGRGHYSRLLAHVVAFARARGFQRVTSRHNAANNAVLVPKLRAGFLLSGFEISDEQGLLATLVHHLDAVRRDAHLFRTGQCGLTPALESVAVNLFTEPCAQPRQGTCAPPCDR